MFTAFFLACFFCPVKIARLGPGQFWPPGFYAHTVQYTRYTPPCKKLTITNGLIIIITLTYKSYIPHKHEKAKLYSIKKKKEIEYRLEYIQETKN